MRVTKFVLLIALSTTMGTGVQAQDGLVAIDNITNTWNEDLLRAGKTHQIDVRYDCTSLSSSGYWVGSNGFEVYSPDGAEWGYLQGTFGPLYGIASARGNLSLFQKHYYFDGVVWSETGESGMDPAPGSGGVNTRVGFYLATFSIFTDAGYLGGMDNDIALTLEFESSLADMGLHLCLDTCDQITAWEWTNGAEDFPIWDNGLGTDGPRCWEICSSPNLPPEWCGGQVEDAVAFSYCTGGSYQLCAISHFMCPTGPVQGYFLAPPYDNGEYGSVNSSGLWTWEGPTIPPGAYEIEFGAFDQTGYTVTNFVLHVLVTETACECVGRVGDANCSGDDEPTIGDIAYIIDRKFILIIDPGWCCLEEADVNQSGGTDPTPAHITIGDISILVDYLFITGPELGLPDCL